MKKKKLEKGKSPNTKKEKKKKKSPCLIIHCLAQRNQETSTNRHCFRPRKLLQPLWKTRSPHWWSLSNCIYRCPLPCKYHFYELIPQRDPCIYAWSEKNIKVHYSMKSMLTLEWKMGRDTYIFPMYIRKLSLEEYTKVANNICCLCWLKDRLGTQIGRTLLLYTLSYFMNIEQKNFHKLKNKFKKSFTIENISFLIPVFLRWLMIR